jgi:DNA-binding IclR family transcriptional regulator
MAEGERNYIIQTAAKTLKLEEWLAVSGDLLEWRTTRQVADGVGLSTNEAYRHLMTLKSLNRVERGDNGWRISPEGIIRFAILAQDRLNRLADRYGLRRPGQ